MKSFNFDELNRELNKHTICDFQIDTYKNDSLTLIGGFDLGYYHQFEIVFSDVNFISCQITLICPRFSVATQEEIKQFKTLNMRTMIYLPVLIVKIILDIS